VLMRYEDGDAKYIATVIPDAADVPAP
jgi:hypothetical protein